VALPGLVLAAIGTTHPHDLTVDTAGWWRDMHIGLAFVFPLLGAAQWVLLDLGPAPVRRLGRLMAFGYAVLYGVLDAMAGIGAGALAVVQGGRTPLADPLFDVGNALGSIGAWCFLVGGVLTTVAVASQAGLRALPGGLLLLVASIVFLDSHIYWPMGVLAMLGLAAGFALLSWVGPLSRFAAPIAAQPAPEG
jgi:hypothetical protein